MMKLQILSDLHVEFAPFDVPGTDANVIVIAGDIAAGTAAMDWMREQNFNKPVIYVPGNHEFYHHDLALIDTLCDAAPTNVHLLNDEAVVIDGVRFLGSILWTDFCVFGETDRDLAMQLAQSRMNDFRLITWQGDLFTPQHSADLHRRSRDWLTFMLGEPFDGPTVVVSHHGPSMQSVAERFRRDLLTPAFTSDLEELIEHRNIALWVHGHTHDCFDYEIAGTQVVCNPRGYMPHEQGNGFDPAKMIEC